MKNVKILGGVVVVFLGVFLFVFGGYDDSPGAQLLGALVATAGVWVIRRQFATS